MIKCNSFSFFLYISLLLFHIVYSNNQLLIRAPSVFRYDEINYHKYSAVLAATEPFKIQCITQIKKSLGPFQLVSYWIRGKSLLNHVLPLRNENIGIDLACSRYETRVDNTLKSYGMTAESFNELSKLLNKSPILKRRILLQAYYYKIAADLEANLKPSLPLLPNLSNSIGRINMKSFNSIELNDNDIDTTTSSSTSDNIISSTKLNHHSSNNDLLYLKDTIKPIIRFAKTIQTIEYARINLRNTIKNELQLKELPPNIADPEIQPALCSSIRKAVQDFPRIANSIIKQNGFDIEEFNQLQKKMDRNFIYRYQVQSEINKLERKK